VTHRHSTRRRPSRPLLCGGANPSTLDQSGRAKHHQSDPRKHPQGGRLQIGTPAGFKSESVAGFLSECLAGFVGIRTIKPVIGGSILDADDAPQGVNVARRNTLACANIIENVIGAVRRVCRNVKYWRSPSMALRWAAAMQKATEGFRRLKAYKHLPALRAALAKQRQPPPSDQA